MDERKFVALARQEVVNYFNACEAAAFGSKITADDVFVVWLCKILGNNKALLSTNVPDGMYYEITYNGAQNCLYVDAYKKCENFKIVL